jgi:hypothetical protein
MYEYNGVSLSRTHVCVTNSFIIEDKPLNGENADNYNYEYRAPTFKVLSPGYFQIDNEEHFYKDSSPFQNIFSEYGNNYNFQQTFRNRKFFK